MLKLHTFGASGFDIAGDWAIEFGPHDGIKCYAMISGSCWLLVDSVPDAIRLEPGDCFLLPRGLPFRLASDLRLPPVNAEGLFVTPPNGGIQIWNGGGDYFGIGSHFAYSGNYAHMLLSELPPVVHIRSESDKAELRWSLDRLRQELREQRPGASLIVQQLTTTILLQALRLHLAENLSSRAGWLFALTNSQLRTALTAMHDEPAHRWTLGELAERSGMSRSIFALRFKTIVGTTPMEYLTRWRMLLAADRLKCSGDSTAAIAFSLGYESESAFRKAFRRMMACSPKQHRQGLNSSNDVRDSVKADVTRRFWRSPVTLTS